MSPGKLFFTILAGETNSAFCSLILNFNTAAESESKNLRTELLRTETRSVQWNVRRRRKSFNQAEVEVTKLFTRSSESNTIEAFWEMEQLEFYATSSCNPPDQIKTARASFSRCPSEALWSVLAFNSRSRRRYAHLLRTIYDGITLQMKFMRATEGWEGEKLNIRQMQFIKIPFRSLKFLWICDRIAWIIHEPQPHCIFLHRSLLVSRTTRCRLRSTFDDECRKKMLLC